MRKINDIVLEITPEDSVTDLVDWTSSNKRKLDNLLIDSPALLFRGFDDTGIDTFSAFSQSFAESMEYIYRSTPRTQLNEGVYTATEYPNNMTIPQHCENAYQDSWPLRLYFYCQQTAEQGGETPLSDIRKVTKAIPNAIKDKFIQHGVMYVRNYSEGLDIPWQTVFQTSDKQVVEKYCDNHSIRYEWGKGDTLKTTQVCQAVAQHPSTHDELWFNQAHLFHISNLEPNIRSVLLDMYSEEGLPRNTYFGNGDKIEDSMLDEIRGIYEQYKCSFSWQNGDIMMIDNMLCSHGRNPFSGSRKVLVSMNSPVSH